ncbi:hypothetical protein QWY87_13770 [Lutimonas halocynthiae]|uniref:hypothetical protein n=1 Tax=Lutimonas halocynthiae TaxID=1446477 RepID=UPI0025B56769|nr:hypothetical protein [Lutimonas halocynthiae]MDN3643780.1 hypothetical protein [Lutimonas halocynthiae]
MKAILPILFLFIINACKEPVNINKKNVTLSLSNKELTKLFEGQELYAIKGIKSKFEGVNARVKSILSQKDYILHLDFNNLYYEGSNELILHSNIEYFQVYNSLKWFIEKNKLVWPKTDLLRVNFKSGLHKNFVLLNIPDKESLEYNEKRFVQLLEYNSKKRRFEVDESEILNIVDYNTCFDYDYKSMVILYVYLDETKIKFNSYSGIKMAPNPITNLIEFVIDYSYISTNTTGIGFEECMTQLSQVKKIDSLEFEKEMKNFLSERELKRKGIEVDKKFKEYIIKDKLNLYEDLCLSNVDLKIEENTEINLYNNSKIIIDKGMISFNGTMSQPVHINGYGENSIFITDVKTCLFNYTFIKGLSNWSDSCKTVPSAITIYNSNSEFNFCEFEDNKRGDDMINLFQSKFTINNCLFKDILSDALDSDFSQGSIINSSYVNIGNDAIDCSGSNLEIINSSFTKISDKAISAGENSNIDISKSKITNSAIGFVSKDGSILNIKEKNVLNENELDFAVFIKKEFYKKPSLYFDGEMSDYKYLIQEKSIVESKDQDSSLIFLKEVETKLYGNEFGKSSK